MSFYVGRGNIGTDPEIKYFGENKDKPGLVARLKLRESVKNRASGEYEDCGPWCDVILWNYPEEALKCFKKGAPVLVVGSLYQKGDYLKLNADDMCPMTPCIENLEFKAPKSKRVDESDEDDDEDGDSEE